MHEKKSANFHLTDVWNEEAGVAVDPLYLVKVCLSEYLHQSIT